MGLENFLDLQREKYIILEYPDLQLAAEKIKRLRTAYILVLFAYARVFYEGRAESKLTWADHLIITKPDGTLLIHGKTKREPINWQPPGCILTAFIENGNLIIKSKRFQPREVIRIEVSELYILLAVKPGKGQFDKFFTEADMVDYVMKHPEFIEPGFTPIQKEAPTRYGFIDLLGKDSEGNLVVLEFKRRKAEVQHVAQLATYVEALLKDGNSKVRGILIAPDISATALTLLKDKGLEFKKMAPRRSGK